MQDLLFYFFAGGALVSGALVVGNPWSRNPVTSAMFLVLSIISLAGLFVLLHAFFLAAVQVLVYAGAVIVLFLFVIMLLNLREEQRRRIRHLALGAGAVAVAAVTLVFVLAIASAPPAVVQGGATREGTTAPLGRLLFSQYVLPFEIVSLVLLVAMVGVVLLSKKDLP